MIISAPEWEVKIGEFIKSLRLQKNISREALCLQAGISQNALRNLESGQGATLKTLVRTVLALGRENWLSALDSQISINPLNMTNQKLPRQRARRKKTNGKK